MSEKRHVCTAEDPWDKGKSLRAEHPDAEMVSEHDYGGGCYAERYQCPHCGLRFSVELPQ